MCCGNEEGAMSGGTGKPDETQVDVPEEPKLDKDDIGDGAIEPRPKPKGDPEETPEE